MSHSKMDTNRSIDSINAPTAAATESDVELFRGIPLMALSKASLLKLSHLLNTKKILRSEEGYERDWRGLAYLAQLKSLYDENAISGHDPMAKVIQLWWNNNRTTATFAFLFKFLCTIDRWDVSDEILENFIEDGKAYQAKLNQCLVLNSNDNANTTDYVYGSDSNVLTTSDVIRAQKGLSPQMYVAFVLYANADVNYAAEMLTKLEDKTKYNFKLCIKDRDLLGGVQFEHVALTQLIEERCQHLIVILTKQFLQSPENEFLVNYTQALQIQHKTRKIVPLIYEENVDIPRTLKIYTHLRYNQRAEGLFNFWSKLANSIQSASVNNAHCKNLALKKPLLDTPIHQLDNLPNPPKAIPSICIVTPAEKERPLRKEQARLKLLPKQSQRKKHPSNDGIVLQSACSVGQLQALNPTTNIASLSDLSTASKCSGNKKQKNWSSKIMKKVF